MPFPVSFFHGSGAPPLPNPDPLQNWTPTVAGFTWQMPANMPPGESSLTLQVSPDELTWYDVETGLGADDQGTYALGRTGGSPIGEQGQTFFARVKAPTLGTYSTSVNANAVGAVGTPTEPTLTANGGSGLPGETYVESYAWPANAQGQDLWENIDSSGDTFNGGLPNQTELNGPYNRTGAISMEWFVKAYNIYSTVESSRATWP